MESKERSEREDKKEELVVLNKKFVSKLTSEKISELTILDASRLKISSVSRDTIHFMKIEVFLLNDNHLRYLKNLNWLYNLWKLDLRNNHLEKIIEFPYRVFGYLFLGNNKFRSYKELLKLRSTYFIELEFQGNPFFETEFRGDIKVYRTVMVSVFKNCMVFDDKIINSVEKKVVKQYLKKYTHLYKRYLSGGVMGSYGGISHHSNNSKTIKLWKSRVHRYKKMKKIMDNDKMKLEYVVSEKVRIRHLERYLRVNEKKEKLKRMSNNRFSVEEERDIPDIWTGYPLYYNLLSMIEKVKLEEFFTLQLSLVHFDLHPELKFEVVSKFIAGNLKDENDMDILNEEETKLMIGDLANIKCSSMRIALLQKLDMRGVFVSPFLNEILFNEEYKERNCQKLFQVIEKTKFFKKRGKYLDRLMPKYYDYLRNDVLKIPNLKKLKEKYNNTSKSHLFPSKALRKLESVDLEEKKLKTVKKKEKKKKVKDNTQEITNFLPKLPEQRDVNVTNIENQLLLQKVLQEHWTLRIPRRNEYLYIPKSRTSKEGGFHKILGLQKDGLVILNTVDKKSGLYYGIPKDQLCFKPRRLGGFWELKKERRGRKSLVIGLNETSSYRNDLIRAYNTFHNRNQIKRNIEIYTCNENSESDFLIASKKMAKKLNRMPISNKKWDRLDENIPFSIHSINDEFVVSNPRKTRSGRTRRKQKVRGNFFITSLPEVNGKEKEEGVLDDYKVNEHERMMNDFYHNVTTLYEDGNPHERILKETYGNRLTSHQEKKKNWNQVEQKKKLIVHHPMQFKKIKDKYMNSKGRFRFTFSDYYNDYYEDKSIRLEKPKKVKKRESIVERKFPRTQSSLNRSFQMDRPLDGGGDSLPYQLVNRLPVPKRPFFTRKNGLRSRKKINKSLLRKNALYPTKRRGYRSPYLTL